LINKKTKVNQTQHLLYNLRNRPLNNNNLHRQLLINLNPSLNRLKTWQPKQKSKKSLTKNWRSDNKNKYPNSKSPKTRRNNKRSRPKRRTSWRKRCNRSTTKWKQTFLRAWKDSA
jgi:hypothetical protein